MIFNNIIKEAEQLTLTLRKDGYYSLSCNTKIKNENDELERDCLVTFPKVHINIEVLFDNDNEWCSLEVKDNE